MTERHRPALTTERVMGIETEFGVAHADLEDRARAGAGGSILLSHLVVGAYALLDPAEGERGRRVRWDYGDETPCGTRAASRCGAPPPIPPSSPTRCATPTCRASSSTRP
ncbi:hypothetical protein [Brachybacterium sp. GPGPB12]|uniref:hypothetical protein n=1 Tax=Brachybacterium sp. GPGPB12 TaxID=3023517 RepID=UPI0031342C10